MKKTLLLLALVSTFGAACKPTAPPAHRKMGSAVVAPTFRQVAIDPSVVGLPGAVGEIVAGPGGLLAWVKNGADATDWQAFPGAAGGTVTSIVAGTGIAVDAGTPTTPAVSNTGVLSVAVSGLLSRSAGTGAITLTGPDTGTVTTVSGSAVQDLSVTGLTGDTDGGYEVEGLVITPAATPEYVAYLNGASATAAMSGGAFDYGPSGPGSVIALDGKTDLYLASVATAEVTHIAFRFRIGSKQGIVQSFTAQSFAGRATGTAFISYWTSGKFNMAAQITQVGVHGLTASSITSGSYIRVRKLGFAE